MGSYLQPPPTYTHTHTRTHTTRKVEENQISSSLRPAFSFVSVGEKEGETVFREWSVISWIPSLGKIQTFLLEEWPIQLFVVVVIKCFCVVITLDQNPLYVFNIGFGNSDEFVAC